MKDSYQDVMKRWKERDKKRKRRRRGRKIFQGCDVDILDICR